jgi:hypothetical protein
MRRDGSVLRREEQGTRRSPGSRAYGRLAAQRFDRLIRISDFGRTSDSAIVLFDN